MHDILVLCYHAISSTWRSSLVVKPDELEHQVKTLLGRGYTPTTFSEALSSPARGGMLVVTFDDGFRSVLDRALPVLDRLRVPATMFVSTAFVGSNSSAAWSGPDAWLTTEYRDELRTLDWPGVSTLTDHGWEIGSHTRTHPHLTTLGDDELRAELRDSKLECERQLGRPCTSIAYPYGESDARVVAAAREAGYVFGCTLPNRFGEQSELSWPRIGVYWDDGPTTFRLKTSRTILHLRRTPVWSSLKHLRQLAPRGEPDPPVKGLS